MKFLFIMDPIENIKPHKDTSYALICAALDRDHELFYTTQHELVLRHDVLFAHCSRIQAPQEAGRHLVVEERMVTDLGNMDAVFIRTDPPFDRRYFYLTLLLDFLPKETQVINRAQTLRDWNEKLAALQFPSLTPRTLVARTVESILGFQKDLNCILTIKPIDGHGGRGIFFLEPGNRNNEAIISAATHEESQWVLAQEYLIAATEGDKRILLLNGEPLGAILRVHAEGKDLNNLDAGGRAIPSELTDAERSICEEIKPYLLEKGLLFTGIDVIGEKLIEINVTSPTGIQEMSRFTGRNLSVEVIEAVEILCNAR